MPEGGRVEGPGQSGAKNNTSQMHKIWGGGKGVFCKWIELPQRGSVTNIDTSILFLQTALFFNRKSQTSQKQPQATVT